mgnify:CR=1 FL=1
MILYVMIMISNVALFTRAWIEMIEDTALYLLLNVALFTRAWIEMYKVDTLRRKHICRPLYEGVD